MHRKFESHFSSKFGVDYERFKEAIGNKPATSIRINPQKPIDGFENMTPIPWSRQGFYLEKRPPFYADPLHHAGGYYVQEASSMFFSGAIPRDKPILALDLCAAPGGKSSLLLSELHPDSLLVSNEMDLTRNRVLVENLNRWGSPNAVVTNAHSKQFKPLEGCFDLVLLDAPCSGEGMFRKDKRALEQWSPNFVSSCAAVQSDLVEDAVQLLKPGGLLIYSTCTFEVEENESQVLRALSIEGFAPVEIPTEEEWQVEESFIDFEGKQFPCYHLYFHKVKGEGQFVCALRKETGVAKQFPKTKKPGFSGVGRDGLKLIDRFHNTAESTYLALVKQSVHAIPKDWVNELNWLKANLSIWKLGVKLGELSTRNFKPAHEWALSTILREFPNHFALEYEEAIAYLKREEVRPNASWKKGWGLASYKGLPLGWLKNLGNRTNNYFPKDLTLRKEIKKAELGELRFEGGQKS